VTSEEQERDLTEKWGQKYKTTSFDQPQGEDPAKDIVRGAVDRYPNPRHAKTSLPVPVRPHAPQKKSGLTGFDWV
jgi:hypothetical protein